MSCIRSFFGKKQVRSYPINTLSSKDFLVAVVEKKVQLVDVRTPREYDDEHIKGAMNIDWFQPFRFKIAIENLDKNKPVYIYCRTGNRSKKAAIKMAKRGFIQLYELEGGIHAVK